MVCGVEYCDGASLPLPLLFASVSEVCCVLAVNVCLSSKSTNGFG